MQGGERKSLTPTKYVTNQQYVHELKSAYRLSHLSFWKLADKLDSRHLQGIYNP